MNERIFYNLHAILFVALQDFDYNTDHAANIYAFLPVKCQNRYSRRKTVSGVIFIEKGAGAAGRG